MKDKFLTLITGLLTVGLCQVSLADNDPMPDFSLLVSQALTGQSHRPLLQCPAISKKFSNVLEQLNEFSQKVKEESNCNSIRERVQNTERQISNRVSNSANLTTPSSNRVFGREQFIEKLTKGLSQSISPAEVRQMQQYIQKVTAGIENLSQIINQEENCLQEEAQGLGLEIIANLSSEIAQLAPLVAGPWGGPISMAGKVVSTLLTSLDQAHQNRQGYRFEKASQRQAYMKTLCSYYKLKQETDKLLYPQESRTQLLKLREVLDDYLDQASQSCTSCIHMMNQFNQSIEPSSSQIQWQNFKDRMLQWSNTINDNYQIPIGTFVLDTLKFKKWIDQELAQLEIDSVEDFGSPGRDLLYESIDRLDDFLLNRTAPEFIYNYSRITQRRYIDFESHIKSEAKNLLRQTRKSHQLYGPLFQSTENLFKTLNFMFNSDKVAAELPFAQKAFKRSTTNKMRGFLSAHAVTQNFCQFFQHSGLYSKKVAQVCESNINQSAAATLQALSQSDLRSNFGYELKMFKNRQTAQYAKTWVESLIYTLQEQSIKTKWSISLNPFPNFEYN